MSEWDMRVGGVPEIHQNVHELSKSALLKNYSPKALFDKYFVSLDNETVSEY